MLPKATKLTIESLQSCKIQHLMSLKVNKYLFRNREVKSDKYYFSGTCKYLEIGKKSERRECIAKIKI